MQQCFGWKEGPINNKKKKKAYVHRKIFFQGGRETTSCAGVVSKSSIGMASKRKGMEEDDVFLVDFIHEATKRTNLSSGQTSACNAEAVVGCQFHLS